MKPRYNNDKRKNEGTGSNRKVYGADSRCDFDNYCVFFLCFWFLLVRMFTLQALKVR